MFFLVAASAVAIAACGRQVTPNPPGVGAGGALPGQISVLFDVAQPFNFGSYQYWIVFNTSNNGLTPTTHPFQDNWNDYSDAIEISGSGPVAGAQVVQFLKNPPPQPPTFIRVPRPPQQQLLFNVNSNGSGTEFNVIFSTALFHPLNATPGPSPTPYANSWTYNAFSTQAGLYNQLVFVDSMGAGGYTDPQYVSPKLALSQCFDQTFYALSSGLQIDPPAQIESVEIANNPVVNQCNGSPAPSLRIATLRPVISSGAP
ncbi:MAG TPA: hypothetical protein VJP76_07250 [Candidatus Tumulicola sp.]|nr:hypothetical protein [Candidatus Tumulicola sp.]